jgi:hypothetical protein
MKYTKDKKVKQNNTKNNKDMTKYNNFIKKEV